jgi:hypothetical protein
MSLNKYSNSAQSRWIPIVYLVLSVAIIALGVVHIAATPHFFPHLTAGAVWFASGGLALVLTGALNLLNRAYGELAFGLRLVCVTTNIIMTCFSLLAGYASRASAAQFVLVIGVMVGASLLSLFRAARIMKP